MIDNTRLPACLAMQSLPPEALVQVASYFQALAEPARLQLLNLLRERERNVGELAELTGYSAANVSRHLALLTQHGLLAREARGNSAYYRIADKSIYALCDLVCDNIARRINRTAHERSPFAMPPKRPKVPGVERKAASVRR
jgi:DNA-binding transcriptional ArsR family regulator